MAQPWAEAELHPFPFPPLPCMSFIFLCLLEGSGGPPPPSPRPLPGLHLRPSARPLSRAAARVLQPPAGMSAEDV